MDGAMFSNRLLKIYDKWKSGNASIDAFLIINGKPDSAYGKTLSLQTWLFSCELQDTAILLCKNCVNILCSQKKVNYLSSLKKISLSGVTIALYSRNPEDNDSLNLSKLSASFLKSGNGKVLGHFPKEIPDTPFHKICDAAIKAEASECVDSSHFFSELFAVKDRTEMGLIKKASDVTCVILSKYLRERIMDIIDDCAKVSHQTIAEGCVEALKDKKIIQGYDRENIEVCYDPILQSGGSYSLKFGYESNKKPLHFGTIVCSLGVRYSSYCSNVVRTFLVQPSDEQTEIYTYLNGLLDWSIEEMKPGVKFSALYRAIVEKVRSERPELEDKLTRSFGFVTGIEFRDCNQVISPKNNTPIEAGMSINLNIGLQDLITRPQNGNQPETYALWLGDVILIGDGSETHTNEVLTQMARRKVSSIKFVIKEEEEEEEDEEDEDVEAGSESAHKGEGQSPGKVKASAKSRAKPHNGLSKNTASADTGDGILGRGHRRAIIEQKTRKEQTSEEKRSKRRRELFESLLENSRNRLTGLKTDSGAGQKSKWSVAYKGVGQMPKEDDVQKLRIFVDKKYETVILPIFGHPTPFHISTLKNVSSSIEADYTYLRINFHHPGAVLTPKETTSSSQAPQCTFLKEMTYRASNQRNHGEATAASTNLNNAYRIIKEVLKRFRSREAEERERADLVEQDELILLGSKGSFRLRDLYIRPNIVTKRITGSLEAHTNGFRFTSARGDKVDILYNNIQHSFYQPCDGEMIILLHFHLKNAIMYGKKKQIDIQFYTEVGELTTDLGKAHSRMHDRDDLESEQRERDMRETIKHAFRSFIDRTEVLARNFNLEFESPYRDLFFFGCPNRSTVQLMPTTSCLVSLSEWPPFVLTLSDVEFVMFERVSLSIRNFDMVFVLKDYRAKPVMINSIPSKSLDDVKQWVISCDIYYAEGTKSLNWPKLMKTIVDNPEDFLEQDGWTFVSPDDEEVVEGEESDEDDDNYVPSEEDSVGEGEGDGEEENSDEDDYDESESDSEDWEAERDTETEVSLDSEESEGKDWDELEKEAIKEDRRLDSRIEEERPHPTLSKKRTRSPHRSPASGPPIKRSKHSAQRPNPHKRR